MLSCGLQQLHGKVDLDFADKFGSHDGPNKQSQEDNEHGEVHDGETDDSALSQSGLLERVNRGPDLTTVRY